MWEKLRNSTLIIQLFNYLVRVREIYKSVVTDDKAELLKPLACECTPGT